MRLERVNYFLMIFMERVQAPPWNGACLLVILLQNIIFSRKKYRNIKFFELKQKNFTFKIYFFINLIFILTLASLKVKQTHECISNITDFIINQTLILINFSKSLIFKFN